jgi:type VI secretion system protein ImpJ
MARYHRIVWSEGLFLTPHHFQQADLFHEFQLGERAALGTAYPWGLRSLEIDTEILATGTFRLLALRGLLPGGLSICLPEIDPAPPSVDFRDAFDIRADHLDIYLGLPVRRSGWPNCRLAAGDPTASAEERFAAKAVTVEDDNTGRNERTIQRAEMNLRLLKGVDSRDNYECLHIARVEKNAAGGYKLVDSFVPPLLAVGGSPYLTQLNRSLLERLVARSSGLASHFTDAGADGRDITPANLRAFLYFSVINGAIPQLAHFRETPATPPEQLYRVLAGLVGQLTTFNAARMHPRDVPPYSHEDSGPVFSRLEKLIIELLELDSSQGYHVIPLTSIGEGRFHARIDKDSLLQASAAIFLSVASEEIGEHEIGIHAPRIIVASPDRIEQKLSLKLRGLPLQFVAVPPPAIPRRRNTSYFQLDTRGSAPELRRDWEAVVASRSLAIDIPRDLLSAEFLLIGLEGTR